MNDNNIRTFFQDLRYSFRTLAKSPTFTTAGILTLGLAIAGNVVFFDLFNALFLTALPVRDPSKLVAIYCISPKGEERGMLLSQMQEIGRRRQQIFEATSGWRTDWLVTTEANGVLSQGEVDGVTGDYFPMLGVQPVMGRLITSSDVTLPVGAGSNVAVIDYRFWFRRFDGDPSVIGKSLRIEGIPFSIIGVTSKSYFGLQVGSASDVTVPITALQEIDFAANRTSSKSLMRINYTLGRLRPNITPGQASTYIQSIWPEILANTIPSNLTPQQAAGYLKIKATLKSAGTGFSFLRDQFKHPLFIIAISGLLILIISCMNLATLALTRAISRDHEMAVRVAVGASPSRINRLLLIENLLLSCTAAVLSLGLGVWVCHLLTHFIWPTVVPMVIDLYPGLRMFAFCFVIALLSGMAFSVSSTWHSRRRDLRFMLQENSRTLGPRTSHLQKSLVVAQLALSTVVLVGAGIFIRSLERLHQIRSGFRTENVVLATLLPIPGGYQHIDMFTYHRELTERLALLPGVRSVSISHFLPGNGGGFTQNISTEPSGGDERGVSANVERISPGFFRTMGLSLLQGRDLDWRDTPQAQSVAVVTMNLAQSLFPQGNAMGKTIRITGGQQANIQIVGIVGDSRIEAIKEPESLMVFVPEAQEPQYMSSPFVEIQVQGDSSPLTGDVRQSLESLGHDYPIMVNTVASAIEDSILPERITAALSRVYAAFALLLVSIGLYGLISYSVSQRTAEIGVRMALGAARGSVLWMVLRHTLALVLAGLAIGIPLSVVLTRLVRQMLFGVSYADPTSLAIAVGALIVFGTLAGYIPAHRATRVDPMRVLRVE